LLFICIKNIGATEASTEWNKLTKEEKEDWNKMLDTHNYDQTIKYNKWQEAIRNEEGTLYLEYLYEPKTLW